MKSLLSLFCAALCISTSMSLGAQPIADNTSPATAVAETGPLTVRVCKVVDMAVDETLSLKQHDPKSSEPVLIVDQEPLLDSTAIASAEVANISTGRWMLVLHCTPEGAARLGKVTEFYIGQRLAYILGDKILLAPMVHEAITNGRIQLASELNEAQLKNLAERVNLALKQKAQ